MVDVLEASLAITRMESPVSPAHFRVIATLGAPSRSPVARAPTLVVLDSLTKDTIHIFEVARHMMSARCRSPWRNHD